MVYIFEISFSSINVLSPTFPAEFPFRRPYHRLRAYFPYYRLRTYLPYLRPAKNNGEIRLSAGKTAQTESLEQLKEILEAQGEQQQELLEEMSGNIRELSRNAQKGKFGLFR